MRTQPFSIVGLIDDDPRKINCQVEGFPVLGGSEHLLSVIEREKVTDVIFAISNEMRPEMFRSLLAAEEQGVEITTMPTIYEKLFGRVPIMLLIGGLVGLLLSAIVSPFIVLAIYLDTGLPVFYTQNRLGQNGQEYTIIKFRTMRKDAERDGKVRVTVENDERITRVGKFLRKSHLDEIPQFINVLRGEMSLVGPRAERSELVNELQERVPFYRARLLVKSGITGWAQINFGYAATVEDTIVKLEYDLYYIKHRNLLLDGMILLRSIGTVIGFKGQ